MTGYAPPLQASDRTGASPLARASAADAQPRRSIAFVLPGIGAGGSEHVVSMLCNHFARLGWAVTLLTFEHEGTAPFYDHAPSVQIKRLGLPAQKQGALWSGLAVFGRLRRLREALRAAKPDIVISFLTRTNILTILSSTGLGVPVIVSERNNPALQHFGPIWTMLRNRLYPRAHGLVAMTQGAMDYFSPAMKRRHWVIPNHAHIPHAPVTPNPAGRRLTAVGRLVPQKGFDLLLPAFAKVASDHPDWTLTIWGEGPDRAALEQQRDALGLAHQVSLPGNTATPGDWIEATDIFVLSSRYEGWGLVVGEAMAAGLPVVSFDCDWGPSEMITHGHDGLLVADGDIAALADGLRTLFDNDEQRLQFGLAARQSMKKFMPEQIVQQWQNMVETVVSAAPHNKQE